MLYKIFCTRVIWLAIGWTTNYSVFFFPFSPQIKIKVKSSTRFSTFSIKLQKRNISWYLENCFVAFGCLLIHTWTCISTKKAHNRFFCIYLLITQYCAAIAFIQRERKLLFVKNKKKMGLKPSYKSASVNRCKSTICFIRSILFYFPRYKFPKLYKMK